MLRGDESPGDGELYVAPDVGGALAGGAVHLPPGLKLQISVGQSQDCLSLISLANSRLSGVDLDNK